MRPTVSTTTGYLTSALIDTEQQSCSDLRPNKQEGQWCRSILIFHIYCAIHRKYLKNDLSPLNIMPRLTGYQLLNQAMAVRRLGEKLCWANFMVMKQLFEGLNERKMKEKQCSRPPADTIWFHAKRPSRRSWRWTPTTSSKTPRSQQAQTESTAGSHSSADKAESIYYQSRDRVRH